jgi:chromosome segregation ATPase
MKDSITDLLDDLSARLGCDIPSYGERELVEKFSEIRDRASEVADEVRSFATPSDALAFSSELSQFLNTARGKAMEARRLRDAIGHAQEQISEAQDEFRYLSAGRSALATKVNDAMLALEAAQAEYQDNELALGVLERRMETRRNEALTLRRELAELTTAQEV